MTFAMLIDTYDYNIIKNDIPVLTRTTDKYIDTNCYLSSFNTESKNFENILSGFDYKSNILDHVKQFGHSPKYTPVLYILTNSNIQTPNFDSFQDLLSVAFFLDKGKDVCTWLDFFEVNRNFRQNIAEKQKYKTVGASMLKSLQQKYSHQGIEGRSTYNALSFYFKHGFKRIDDCELYLRWQPQR